MTDDVLVLPAPYDLIADPTALGLLKLRVSMGLDDDPEDLRRLAEVAAERKRRASFSASGSFTAGPGASARGRR